MVFVLSRVFDINVLNFDFCDNVFVKKVLKSVQYKFLTKCEIWLGDKFKMPESTVISDFVKKITPKWREMLDLPFLKGVINGSLSKESFLEYLIQDTIYLKDYAKCYAYAMTKTNNIEIMRILYDCLGIISKDESCVHIIYLKDLGYTESKALCRSIHEVNRKYLDYILM